MTGAVAGSAAPADPPPEAVERFAAALARAWPEGGRLGLAVSGGPDSLAMLLLAQAAIAGRFEVATVDHGIRPEAIDECMIVQAICNERAIECAVLEVLVPGGNIQAAARHARYAALAEWAGQRELSAIATAHHADDQAETLLMRLNRGSGVAGLAGVREAGSRAAGAVPLIRPLLGFRRAELAAIVAAAGIEPVADPSNADDRFERARVRKAIAGSDWLHAAAMARSAANLADGDEALRWAAEREWAEGVAGPADGRRYRRRAPRAIALRVVERIIAEIGGQPRGGDMARLLDALERGESGNVAGVLASVEGEEWVFRAEPPRRTG